MLFGKKTQTKLAFWILPVLVYIVVFLFNQLIAQGGNCDGWWDVCWARWDSALYLQISKIGHTLFHCGPDLGYPTNSLEWCGNAGWAPFYPLLINVFHKVSKLDPAVCGVLLTHAFFICFLYIIASIIEIQSFKLSNWLSLLLCSICPGAIYFFGIFPLSLIAFLISIVFWSIYTKKYGHAIIPSYLIAMSYSSSIIIFFSIGIYLIYLFWVNRRRKNLLHLFHEIKEQLISKTIFRTILLNVMVPGILGLLSLYTYDWFATGHWDSMFLIQHKYGHLLYNPFHNLVEHYRFFISHKNNPKALIDFHNIFFFFAIPFLIYLLVKNKNSITPLLILFTLAMWYIPFSIGIHVSLHRSIAILAPVMIFLHPLKNLYKIALLLVFGVLYYFMGVLFILSILP